MIAADRDGLLSAILAEPGVDLHRLAYADWLEENGRQAQARFIRSQIMPCLANRTWHVATGDFLRFDFEDLPGEFYRIDAPPGVAFAVRRGFVEAVRCDLAAWQEHGPAVVRLHPVTAVRLTDREPQDYHNNSDGEGAINADVGHLHGWMRGGDERHSLPADLWDLVAPADGVVIHGGWADFRSADLAHGALSRAALAWAKAALLPGDRVRTSAGREGTVERVYPEGVYVRFDGDGAAPFRHRDLTRL